MIQKTEGVNSTQTDEISEKNQLFQVKNVMLLEKIEDAFETSIIKYLIFSVPAVSLGMVLGMMSPFKNFQKYFQLSRQQDTSVAQVVDPEELEHGIEMVEIQES